MDFKRYAGKEVWVQFKQALPWIAVQPDKEGHVVVAARMNEDSGEPEAVPMPFVSAMVTEDGAALLVGMAEGGVLELQLNEDVVHSVAATHKAPSSLITPQSPLVS